MRVNVNGTDLYFDVEGPQLTVDADGLAERPTVVVLHGGPGFDQGYLRPGLHPLSAAAQLVFVDLRRQGRSGKPPVETCTLEQMADDVAALCARLGIAAPVVFGHSAGGFVALHLALRHPETVGALVLCATTPTLEPLPDQDPPPSVEQRASAEAAEVARRLFGGDFSEETFAAFGRLVAPVYAGPRHVDVPGRLLPLSSFASDVAGGYDWVCPPIASGILASAIPDARLVEIADAGHFPFSEEPEAFQDAVGAFLDAVTTARAWRGWIASTTTNSISQAPVGR